MKHGDPGIFDLDYHGYNSLENPIGIETRLSTGVWLMNCVSYNSLENPIGIETLPLGVIKLPCGP